MISQNGCWNGEEYCCRLGVDELCANLVGISTDTQPWRQARPKGLVATLIPTLSVEPGRGSRFMCTQDAVQRHMVVGARIRFFLDAERSIAMYAELCEHQIQLNPYRPATWTSSALAYNSFTPISLGKKVSHILTNASSAKGYSIGRPIGVPLICHMIAVFRMLRSTEMKASCTQPFSNI